MRREIVEWPYGALGGQIDYEDGREESELLEVK